MNHRRFSYRPSRTSLSHHGTGRVRPERPSTDVSLDWRLLTSMTGTIGSGPKFVERNFTGRPVSLRFQRSVKSSRLSSGSARPSRPFSASCVESSFLNCPLLSRREPASE